MYSQKVVSGRTNFDPLQPEIESKLYHTKHYVFKCPGVKNYSSYIELIHGVHQNNNNNDNNNKNMNVAATTW